MQVGGVHLSPLQALLDHTRVMTARYRTGDGTGLAAVTPATSCVQDSSQALYLAIAQIKQQVSSQPDIFAWLQAHPQAPEAQKFEQLVALGHALEALLVPTGVVRSDWQDNAKVLAGVGEHTHFGRQNTLLNSVLSWRSMLPRRAHDEVSRIFLTQGAPLWFLRSHQTLHWDSTMAPLAPTVLFGQVPVLSTVLRRLIDAVAMPLTVRDLGVTAGIVLGYGAIALPLGVRLGFLQWHSIGLGPNPLLWGSLKIFMMPALGEELFFRVALLPHPLEGVPEEQWLAWAALSLGLFILYHPLNARTLYRAGHPTFLHPTFLLLAGLLGVACSLAYGMTQSLWPAVVVHWLVVTMWFFRLGGRQLLLQDQTSSREKLTR